MYFFISMTTRIISIREFRENMTGLLREAQAKDIHFVIMRHAVPVARVAPFSKKEMALEELTREIAEARAQAKRGEVFTQKEIEKMMGL